MTLPRQDGSVITEPNGIILVICELFSVGALVLVNLALITCDFVTIETPELHMFSMGYLLRQHIQCDSNLFAFEARYCRTYDECYSYYLEDDYKGHLLLYDKIWTIGRAFNIVAHVIGVSAVLVPYSTFLFAAHRQKQIFQVLTGLYIAGAIIVVPTLIVFKSSICEEFTCSAGLGVYCTIGSSLGHWIAALVCILGALPKTSSPHNTSSNDGEEGGTPDGANTARTPPPENTGDESEEEVSVSNLSHSEGYVPIATKSTTSQGPTDAAQEEEKTEDGEETSLTAFVTTWMEENDNSYTGSSSNRHLDRLCEGDQYLPIADSCCSPTATDEIKMKTENNNDQSFNDLMFEVEEGKEIEITASTSSVSLNYASGVVKELEGEIRMSSDTIDRIS